MSRTRKSAKNIVFNLSNVLLTSILMFGIRTLFIHTLGVTYLGLNGVFRNIFQFMSLAELGVGSAIAFRLYKPLEMKDERRIAALMSFYKTAYRTITLIIIMISIGLLPFLNNLIGGAPEGVNIYVIYAIYVLQTVSTYMFFAYKMTLLRADQREFIISEFDNLFVIITSFLEAMVLYFFQSFTGYLLALVFSNIMKNILISRRIDKDYPFINQYEDKIDREELIDLFKDFFATFLYKMNNVVLNSTDNLIISYYLGLETVGLYSNYVLINNSVRGFLNPTLTSIKSSLGSFIATKSKEKTYELFLMLNILTVFLFGGASIGIFILSNRFIELWIGQGFHLSTVFVLFLSIDFYTKGYILFLDQVRSAMGLFQQLKYRPLMSMILNLAISLLLVQTVGLVGVILGTVLSTVLTNFIFDPIIIHSYGFEKSPALYYLKNIYYLLLVLATGAIAYIATGYFPDDLIGLFLSFLATLVIILVVFTIGLIGLKEARELLNRVFHFVRFRN